MRRSSGAAGPAMTVNKPFLRDGALLGLGSGLVSLAIKGRLLIGPTIFLTLRQGFGMLILFAFGYFLEAVG